MAGLLWFVMVSMCVKTAFSIGGTCDECLRSGDRWCHKKINNYNGHCYSPTVENLCNSTDVEPIPVIHNVKGEDGSVRPRFTEMTIYIIDPSREVRTTTIKYDAPERKAKYSFTDVTNGLDAIDVDMKNTCQGSECILTLSAMPNPVFCSTFNFTYVDINVKLEGITTEAIVRYHVACACECTKDREVNSEKCNFNGNYTCGVCSCNSETYGDNCEKHCKTRGDQPPEEDCLYEKNGEKLECAGNGHCECGNCVCHKNKEGSQYFEANDLCADVCSLTIECHECLRANTAEWCSECNERDVTVLKRNDTEAERRDEYNRTVWMQCVETVDDCTFNYRAMREGVSFFVMMNTTCNDIVGAGGRTTTGSQVPLILGILTLVALVVAGGGVLLWKHMNSIPPLPAASPNYKNIGAEDCTGENPLYKPPTSSFKNPTYGKW